MALHQTSTFPWLALCQDLWKWPEPPTNGLPSFITGSNCATWLARSLPSDYTAIVHSDHGGHDRNHGTDLEEDMTIPWMAVGPAIKKGHTIQSQVSLLDTAPTIAKLLELKPHRDWEGKCVEEILA
jgi:hypothetical protein